MSGTAGREEENESQACSTGITGAEGKNMFQKNNLKRLELPQAFCNQRNVSSNLFC